MTYPELIVHINSLSHNYDYLIECGSGEYPTTTELINNFDTIFSIEIASHLYYKAVPKLLEKGIIPLYGNCAIHLNHLIPAMNGGYLLFIDIGDNILDLRKTLESVIRCNLKDKKSDMAIVIRGMNHDKQGISYYNFEQVNALIKSIYPKGFDFNEYVFDGYSVCIFERCL